MSNFKLNESDILSNQDWTFPTNIAYGPGRLKEIGTICNNLNIKNLKDRFEIDLKWTTLIFQLYKNKIVLNKNEMENKP